MFFIFVFFILFVFLSATIINIPADQPTIQEGIDVAIDGDTVLVQPGTYVENINYNCKNIYVASLFLTTQDTTYISNTIIDGDQNGSVVRFNSGEDSTAVLTGFTITDGNYFDGGGIYCYESSPSLMNVTITGNSASSGGGIYCRNNSSPVLQNLTITDNSADWGSGIYCRDNSNPILVNCIMWYDSPEEIFFSSYDDPNLITISYSDIQGGEAGIVTNNTGTVYWLEGNIDADPLFVGTGEHPYSLLEDSPCIDAGIPDTTGLNLPPWDIIGNLRIWDGDGDGDGNGIAIIDMGAYEYGAPPYVEIDDNIIVQTPEVLLHQNFPNPFNPATTITFNPTVENVEDAELIIYNIKGQKIKKLEIRNLKLGINDVVWNGTDKDGKSFSSGVYFYKLNARDFQQIKKMVLLK